MRCTLFAAAVVVALSVIYAPDQTPDAADASQLLDAVGTDVNRLDVGPMWADEPLHLLTIGDEMLDDSTHYLRAVVRAQGRSIVHRRLQVVSGGLRTHWEMAQLHASAPDDLRGTYEGRGTSLSDVLGSARDRWDVVLIQQAPGRDATFAEYGPYLAGLVDLVRLKAPSARVLLHQNWPAGGFAEFMQIDLACVEAAHAFDMEVLPAGAVLCTLGLDRTLLRRPGWDGVEVGSLVQPPIPGDDRRASTVGRYAASVALYEALFGNRSSISCSFHPEGMDADFALECRRAAAMLGAPRGPAAPAVALSVAR